MGQGKTKQELQTPVIKKTLNPDWELMESRDNELVFQLREPLESRSYSSSVITVEVIYMCVDCRASATSVLCLAAQSIRCASR